jgi:putative transposase
MTEIRLYRLLKEFNIPKSNYYRVNTKMFKRDQNSLKVIKKYFHKSKDKYGIRQLKMVIKRSEDLVMNHKRIARIKHKFGLVTKIRKKNIYRKFAKKKQEHETCPNLLDRKFRSLMPNQVYSTDITTIKYNHKKVYLAAVKDLGSKDIVGFNISNRIDLKLSNTAIDKALNRLSVEEKANLMIHSDQGFHYTHFSYRKKLKDNGITQSMSRKGNCIDNSPIESFFGLLKDHIDLQSCKNLTEVKKEVTKKIKYYNKVRPQLGLKKMPPSEYRRHLGF